MGLRLGGRRIDDLILERAERAQDLVLLALADVELDQRAGQGLDESGELLVDQLHAGVGGVHVAPFVLARAAGGDADEVDEVDLELRDVGVDEAQVDALVRGDPRHEFVDDQGDRRFAAQPIEQRGCRRRGCGTGGRRRGGRARHGRLDGGGRRRRRPRSSRAASGTLQEDCNAPRKPSGANLHHGNLQKRLSFSRVIGWRRIFWSRVTAPAPGTSQRG